MTPEKPAEGILKTHDFGDSKFYTIPCSCGNPDDEIDLEIEADECGVTVHHYVKTKTEYWSEPTKLTWLNGLIRRIKLTWNIWLYGYVEMHTYTILSEQSTLNYSETLKQAIQDVKNFRESRKK